MNVDLCRYEEAAFCNNSALLALKHEEASLE